MSRFQLPERASLEYLKRRAKEHLAELCQRDPRAKLAAAQLAIARDPGFPSWGPWAGRSGIALHAGPARRLLRRA